MLENLEVRERILKTASELFHKQGYYKTGINQIIKESNVAKASLYYHFATKDDLCIAYLKERHKEWEINFNTYMIGKQDKVLASFDFLMKDNEQNNFRGCSFLNLLPETTPDQKDILNELQSHKIELLKFFQMELKTKNVNLAYTVYSLFENAIIESKLFQSQQPVIQLKEAVASLLK